jgi:hypothetical protein
MQMLLSLDQVRFQLEKFLFRRATKSVANEIDQLILLWEGATGDCTAAYTKYKNSDQDRGGFKPPLSW